MQTINESIFENSLFENNSDKTIAKFLAVQQDRLFKNNQVDGFFAVLLFSSLLFCSSLVFFLNSISLMGKFMFLGSLIIFTTSCIFYAFKYNFEHSKKM